jgi:predicted nicotinamide N-methyase
MSEAELSGEPNLYGGSISPALAEWLKIEYKKKADLDAAWADEEEALEGLGNIFADSNAVQDALIYDPNSVCAEHSWTNPNTQQTVFYHLAPNAPGFGDVVWNFSTYVSECVGGTGADLQFVVPQDASNGVSGLRMMELGAGAGLPSWTYLANGASVVCTDMAQPDQLVAMASSAQKNMEENAALGRHAGAKGYVRNHNWEQPEEVEELLACGSESEEGEARKYDVMVAADCIFLHRLHEDMLNTIVSCLKPTTGILLVGFSLHANVEDEKVFEFFEKAKKRGLTVEQCRLPSLESRNQKYLREVRSRSMSHPAPFLKRFFSFRLWQNALTTIATSRH